MPRRPWKRSDNIKRVLSQGRVAALLTALRGLRAKNAPWVELDADDAEAWWRAVLHDSRARRARADRIAPGDVDASLRLDRWPGAFVTFRCLTCGAHATYEVAELAGVRLAHRPGATGEAAEKRMWEMLTGRPAVQPRKIMVLSANEFINENPGGSVGGGAVAQNKYTRASNLSAL